MSATPHKRPTETEIEDYLTKDLMIRKARGESADEALDANYELGLRLRQAIDAKYLRREAPAKRGTSRLMRAMKWIVGYAASFTIVWAAFGYFGHAAVPYVAILGVMAVYGYFQTKFEDLQIESNARYDGLCSRIEDLEATINGPELNRILQDFERTRVPPEPLE